MKKIILSITLLIIASLALIGLYRIYVQSNSEPSSPQGEIEQITTTTSSEATEILATNLQIPWSLDFLPNDDIIFTERGGELNLLSNGEVIKIATITDVKAIGEGGLMGVELHPEFENNNLLYLMYTYSSDGDDTLNRVARYTYKDNELTNEVIIVDEIPGARFHNGGRIKFGPDGFLYIATGDSQNPSLSQNRSSLAGKILKVDEDGNPAPENPFDTRVYSYGHRNPQGLTWDTEGKLWSTEHGRSNPTGYDEVNLIESGGNYGWPEIEGNETRSDMITPIANSGLGTWAPGSAAYLNGSLFFGGLRPETLFELRIDNDNFVLVEHLVNQYGRIRDVVVGPDNFLYITTSNKDGRGEATEEDDRIIRIDPRQL